MHLVAVCQCSTVREKVPWRPWSISEADFEVIQQVALWLWSLMIILADGRVGRVHLPQRQAQHVVEYLLLRHMSTALVVEKFAVVYKMQPRAVKNHPLLSSWRVKRL